MAATVSPLPGIRGETMRGPADVQQRLPSLNEVSRPTNDSWLGGVADLRSFFLISTDGSPEMLRLKDAITTFPVLVGRHQDFQAPYPYPPLQHVQRERIARPFPPRLRPRNYPLK